jgi:uncharacterized protein (TIGR00106 family)
MRRCVSASNARACGSAVRPDYAPRMAIAAVSLSPLGVGISVSEYVAVALSVLERQDRVRWKLDSMFTTLEGEPDEIFELVRAMQEAIFAAGAARVGTVIKMDDRRDRPGVGMEEKVESALSKLEAHRDKDD